MTKSEQTSHNLKNILHNLSSDYTIKLHGVFRHPIYPGWKASTQNYDDLHLLYVRDGEGYYHMHDNTTLPLKKGSLTFITHHFKHYASTNLDNPLKIVGIRFGIYDKASNDITAQLIAPFYYHTYVPDTFQYDSLTQKIDYLYHKEAPSIRQTLETSYITQIIYDLYLSASSPNQFSPDTLLDQAKQLIEEGIYKDLKIYDIATQLGISTRHLQKLFKSNYDLTPKAYYLQLKMQCAYNMLKYENKNIKEIADTLGYSDSFVFSRQFKSVYGIAPSSVRNRPDES